MKSEIKIKRYQEADSSSYSSNFIEKESRQLNCFITLMVNVKLYQQENTNPKF